MSDVNFIPADRRHRMQVTRHLGLMGGICAAWLVLLGVAVAVTYAMYSTDQSAVTGELQGVSRRLEEDTEVVNTLMAQVAAAQSALEGSKATSNQPNWSVLLAILADKLGDDVVLSACELSPEGVNDPAEASEGPHVPLNKRNFTVTVAGFGRSQASVSRFVLALENIELFRQVKLVSSNRNRFYKTEAVAFKLECAL